MDEAYDVIILGTGLKECILSGVLSVEGKKVLHIDRNSYYGGETASLTLTQLYEKFKGTGTKPPADLGASREWNVDSIPKFLMSSESLVNILVKTDVTRYLEFKSVSGSFVTSAGKVYKVPTTGGEAFKSSLVSLFQKYRCYDFLGFVGEYDEKDSKTWAGKDLKKMSAKELFQAYSLDSDTIDFIGHGMALRANDSYLNEPALDTVKRIRLYGESMMKYGNSPYIYPLYGIGDMPQGFARLSAIYGGTYMLNKPPVKISYEGGVFSGISIKDDETETVKEIKAQILIGDPSYFPDKVKKVGQVARCIVLLRHPIPNTNDADSCQIIVSQKETKRKNDIYVSCVSHTHNVAPKGMFIAFISTIVETANPLDELKAGLVLLGPYKQEEVFFAVNDLYEPVADGVKDKVFITKSFDSETFFSSGCDDIFDVYKRITGKEMDVTPPKKEEKEEKEKGKEEA